MKLSAKQQTVLFNQEGAVMNWRPIATAPKDGSPVRLRDEQKTCTNVMAWNRKAKRWEGTAYTMMGAVKTWWDESLIPVHEWEQA